MPKLILVMMFLPAISFACGYGLRDWISRRRRRKVRKRFHEKYTPHALAPKTEAVTGASRRELTIQDVNERLSRLEDKIVNTTLEIEAFRRETQIEFFAARELLEQKFEEPQHRNNGGRLMDPH